MYLRIESLDGRLSLAASRPFADPKQRRDGFSVDDFACHDHPDRLSEGKKPHRDALILLRLSKSFFKAAGQIDRHAFLKKPRAYVEVKASLPLLCGVARFLQEFAPGRSQLALARIDAPRR